VLLDHPPYAAHPSLEFRLGRTEPARIFMKFEAIHYNIMGIFLGE
jgi:hypothetical protein